MEKNAKLHRLAERGATVIEYALIVGLIALVAVVALPMVGNNTFTALREVSSNLDEAGADLHPH